MTFMRIFPFDVRVFAHFTLKQGKKQEPKQINNCSLGERAWRVRMHGLPSVTLRHLIQKDLYQSPFKWLSLLTPFPYFHSFDLQRDWLLVSLFLFFSFPFLSSPFLSSPFLPFFLFSQLSSLVNDSFLFPIFSLRFEDILPTSLVTVFVLMIWNEIFGTLVLPLTSCLSSGQ